MKIIKNFDIKIQLYPQYVCSKSCIPLGDEKLDLWSIFIIELSRIASSTNTNLKAKAIQAITMIIQVEVI